MCRIISKQNYCFKKVTTIRVIITVKDEFRSKLTVERPNSMGGDGLLLMATGYGNLLMVGAVGAGQVKKSHIMSSYSQLA